MTHTMTTTHPLPTGAMARVTKRARDLGSGLLIRENHLFEVEGYVPADESEDGTAYYYGWDDNIGSLEVDAEHVVLDMTPEQVEARALPTADKLVHAIDVLVDAGSIRTTQAERLPDGKARVYGQTADGLRFSFTVTVSDITRLN